jgi:RsiW-degrading membrane proteinase PrsW (M82 family)
MKKIVLFFLFAVLLPVISNLLPIAVKPLKKVHGRWPSTAVVIWTALSGMTSALAHLFFQELKHSFR